MQTAALVDRIVRTPDICGGKARIAGHRIRVRDVVSWIEIFGKGVDEIAHEYDLEQADVYMALAYYHANRKVLKEEWKEEDALVEQMKRKYPSRLNAIRRNG
ncbi:MAG: DUF433 domain-containing protein [Bacteroidota bacterium]